MTDIPELASLTIKDLRQLAGEHNIQSRSRLDKDQLIQALTEILSPRGQQPSGALAPERPASPQAFAAHAVVGGTPAGDQHAHDHAAHASSQRDQPSDDDADDDADAPKSGDDDADDDAEASATEVEESDAIESDDGDTEIRPSLAGASAPEPEDITAESLAGLGPQAPHRHDQQGGRGPFNEGQPQAPGEPGRGRRRRRRRGRGRGRDGEHGAHAQGDQGAHSHGGDDGDFDRQGGIPDGDDGEDEGEAAPRDAPPRDPASARQGDTRPDDRPRQDRPNHERHHDRASDRQGQDRQGQDRPGDRHGERQDHRDQQRDQPRGQTPSGEGHHRHGDRQAQRDQIGRPPQGQQQPQGQRPPRPRLEGQQRSVPSVLDRLCSFSRGILELCSPDTPGWAQPRLGELLAEAGMVPMPTSGMPHADFHEVIGTMASAQVPPGHIAQVLSPGFALRGDRGDLFPLRRARVRVAEGGRAAPIEPEPSAGGDSGPEDLGDGPEERIEDMAPGDAPVDAPPIDEPDELLGDHPAQDDPRAEPEDREDHAQAPAPAPAPAPARATVSGTAAAPLLNGNAQGLRPQPPVRSGPPARPGAPARQGPPPARQGPPPARAAPPAQGRPPLRPHARESASDSPSLPLATQVPDELAQRPKAEGFRALGLNDQILADLSAIGYQTPTPIQLEAIPIVLSGKDMIGQAQTGTGKTAAFALPMLQSLYSAQGHGPVALVLCPTRELARQVHAEFTKMAGASGARAALIYGGVPMDDQMRALERHPHVVIGTPGRIIDHMRRHTLDLSRLRVAVLDEADQMLDIGFWPDVNFIISHSPPTRQMLLFSATFPDPIRVLAQKHMREPVHVRIAPAQVTVEQVDQKYIAVPRERKNELLAHFIETQNPEQLVVFCKTKHQTDRVAEVLKRKRMSAAAIHGDLPQSRRERTLAAFRARELQCLIATNVAARGLDIPTVSHVLNYDIPEAPEEYVHRIGRTARNGARGVARTFITPEDGQFLVEIEKHIGLLLEEERIEGFSLPQDEAPEVKRSIADMPVGTPRLLKPLVGGIRLGRRR